MRMKMVKGTRIAPAVMRRHPRRLSRAGNTLNTILREKVFAVSTFVAFEIFLYL
jgi:hypothetical protein